MNLPKPDKPGSEWLPTQPDRSYRRGMAQLRWRHFNGTPALDLAAEHCRLVDLSLPSLLKTEPTRGSRQPLAGTGKTCWLALGAYGSLELTPYSPVRLLLTGSIGDGEASRFCRGHSIPDGGDGNSRRSRSAQFPGVPAPISDGYGLLPGAAVVSMVGWSQVSGVRTAAAAPVDSGQAAGRLSL